MGQECFPLKIFHISILSDWQINAILNKIIFMRWLLFAGRVALLCNVCFVMAMIIRYTKDFIHNQTISSYIITLGYSAFFINLFLNLFIVIALFRKTKTFVPAWLAVINLVFFIAQIIVFFI